MLAQAVTQNKQLLQYPIVQPFDLLVARAVLEILSAFTVGLIFFAVLYFFDVDVIPLHPTTALIAVYASVFFGVAAGFCGSVIVAVSGLAGYLIFIFTLVGLYLSSGVYMPITAVDETMQWLVGLNPLYHLVEWMRSAYYESHSAAPIDKTYVLLVAFALLGTGLAGERLFRGKIIN